MSLIVGLLFRCYARVEISPYTLICSWPNEPHRPHNDIRNYRSYTALRGVVSWMPPRAAELSIHPEETLWYSSELFHTSGRGGLMAFSFWEIAAGSRQSRRCCAKCSISTRDNVSLKVEQVTNPHRGRSGRRGRPHWASSVCIHGCASLPFMGIQEA